MSTPIATVIYNNKVLTTLNGGERVTLDTRSKQMSGDIEIEIADYIKPEVVPVYDELLAIKDIPK